MGIHASSRTINIFHVKGCLRIPWYSALFHIGFIVSSLNMSPRWCAAALALCIRDTFGMTDLSSIWGKSHSDLLAGHQTPFTFISVPWHLEPKILFTNRKLDYCNHIFPLFAIGNFWKNSSERDAANEGISQSAWIKGFVGYLHDRCSCLLFQKWRILTLRISFLCQQCPYILHKRCVEVDKVFTPSTPLLGWTA